MLTYPVRDEAMDPPEPRVQTLLEAPVRLPLVVHLVPRARDVALSRRELLWHIEEVVLLADLHQVRRL